MPRPTGPRASVVSRPLRKRIERAATLRAEGRSWSATATELNLSVGTVEGYPRRYPKLWASAERRAWDRALAEAAAEAVTTLRRLLRHDDEKINRDAAAKLVQFAARRLRPVAARKLTPAVPPVVAYLEGLSDADLAALAADLWPAPPGEPGPADDAAAHVSP